MLKKLIISLLTVSMLFTGTVVFASGTTATDAKTKVATQIQDLRQNAAELKPLMETIRTNRTQLIKLRADGETAYKKAKAKLKEMIKNKDNLTPEQIEIIKQDVKTITEDRKLIANTIGSVEKESAALRVARSDKNLEVYKQSLNDIIAIQNSRITNLKKTIDDLNKI